MTKSTSTLSRVLIETQIAGGISGIVPVGNDRGVANPELRENVTT
jgi:hypothetical protein